MDSPVLTSVVLPAAIAVIMLSLGMTLTPADFRRVLFAPRGVAVGVLNMALIGPLLALTIASAFGLSPELAVGLVLLGASPGGMMANMLTHLSRGDTALSITITAVTSIGAIVTMPLFLGLAAAHFGTGDMGEVGTAGVVVRVFAITVVPVAVGMDLRRRWPRRVEDAYPRVRDVSLAVFCLVIVAAIVSEYDTVAENLAEVGAAALALNVAGMSVSFGTSKLAGLDDRQATAICLAPGIHNTAIAIAVGASLAAALTIPAAVYASLMLITSGGFAWAMRGRNAAAASLPA